MFKKITLSAFVLFSVSGLALALEDGVYTLGGDGFPGRLTVFGDRIEIFVYSPSSGCTGEFMGTITRIPGSDTWTAVSDPMIYSGQSCTLHGDSEGFGRASDGCVSFSGVRCGLQSEILSGPEPLEEAAPQSPQEQPQPVSPPASSAPLSPEETATIWVPLLRQYFESHYNSELALFQSQVLLILSGQRDLEPDGQWGPRTEAAFRDVSRTIATIGFSAEPTPQGVADRVINWMLDLTRAEILQGDLPD